MSRRPIVALAIAAALLGAAPSPAAAEESPVLGSVEFRAGGFRPDADAGLTIAPGDTGPYQKAFGNGRPWGFWLHVARALPWRQYGTVELGGGAGYWAVKGQAVDVNGAPTSEKTAFKIVPTELSVTYRADVLWERWRVPFVPYGRLALQRYNWWITGPSGSTTKSGATNGWGVSGGVGLVLDLLDPMLAREFDADIGVNHTILIFDVAKNTVDDFGSKTSIDLTDAQGVTWSLGLLFVF